MQTKSMQVHEIRFIYGMENMFEQNQEKPQGQEQEQEQGKLLWLPPVVALIGDCD